MVVRAKKQKNVQRHEIHAKGDQYIFIAMAGTQKAIVSWRVGKRNMDSTMDFLHDLRGRVIGQPEISTDGFHPYRMAIRDAFGDSASHGVINKTYSVTNLAKDAATPLLARRRSSCKPRGSKWRCRSIHFDQLR